MRLIRKAVEDLRPDLREAEAASYALTAPVTRIQSQLEVIFIELSRLAARPLDPGSRAGFEGLLHGARQKLNRLVREFDAAHPR